MAIMVLLVIYILVFVVACALNGFALMYLWKWFMVPLGLVEIDLCWAIGVSIVVGFLTNHEIKSKDEKKDGNDALVFIFVRPLLALLVGWIVLQIWK